MRSRPYIVYIYILGYIYILALSVRMNVENSDIRKARMLRLDNQSLET